MSRALSIVGAALLGLAGSLVATVFLFHAAEGSLGHVLDEHLRGAGESAAILFGSLPATQARLRELMKADDLDGAYVLDRSLTLVADAQGRAGRPADLLRVDPDRVAKAFDGVATVRRGYALGNLTVTTGYFPVRGADGKVNAVLGVEAGEAFAAARSDLRHALIAAVLLSVLAAIGLALAAAGWTRLERGRRLQAEKAARGESIARMGAMVAHEIRNPLGVIRASVDLMRDGAFKEPSREREQLDDILGEVLRMHRLTEDFLSLGTPDRPVVVEPTDLGALVETSVHAARIAFRETTFSCETAKLPPVPCDAHRLRQVFGNLLANAAQACEGGQVEVRADMDGRFARVSIHDAGPGIPEAVRASLFDPFLTTKPGGTGLGLAVARMLVQRHGGTLSLLDDGRSGTTFEVRLPVQDTREPT